MLFTPEIKYVLHVLLNENLNFADYEVILKEEADFVFTTDEGSITIANCFFSGNIHTLYNKEKLPQSVKKTNFEGHEIVSLYHRGDGSIAHSGANIILNCDIIGSSYFLLTQWESTIGGSDHLGRYDYHSSSIKRFDLYKTPVVNQYILFLQHLLGKIGIKTERHKYKPIFSSDIDCITKYSSLRNLLGGLRHRKELSVIREYFQSRNNKEEDPYYSFPYLFGQLGKKGIDSVFYFMTEDTDSLDTKDYDLKEDAIQKIVEHMKESNYKMGLHPGINSWRNINAIKSQRDKLQTAFSTEIKHARQHYLRYDTTQTWSHYQEVGLSTDSSVQFTEGQGFAAGMCTPYSLYDITNRQRLNVKEVPLIYMKKKNYVKDVEAEFEKAKSIIDIAKKYNGEFMILFHNADLETENERKLFENVLGIL